MALRFRQSAIVALLLLAASTAFPADKLHAIPEDKELKEARVKLSAIYDGDFAVAKTLEAKQELAERLMQAVDRYESDRTVQYVLLLKAQETGRDAVHGSSAIQSTMMLVNLFESKKKGDCTYNECFQKAEQLWKKSAKQKGRDRRATQLDAFEWYWLSRPGVSKLDGEICDKRLSTISVEWGLASNYIRHPNADLPADTDFRQVETLAPAKEMRLYSIKSDNRPAYRHVKQGL